MEREREKWQGERERYRVRVKKATGVKFGCSVEGSKLKEDQPQSEFDKCSTLTECCRDSLLFASWTKSKSLLHRILFNNPRSAWFIAGITVLTKLPEPNLLWLPKRRPGKTLKKITIPKHKGHLSRLRTQHPWREQGSLKCTYVTLKYELHHKYSTFRKQNGLF